MEKDTHAVEGQASSGEPRLDVVLCWHMHQPQYREQGAGMYRLPWTYLHALKDYTDMAGHLETIPGARAVVNFAPILLVQIDDYARQVQAFLEKGQSIPDPVLALLATETVPEDATERAEILRVCLRAHAPRMIDPMPLFAQLARVARMAQTDPTLLQHLDPRFFLDLCTCYHLAWMGETVRREHVELQTWLQETQGFTTEVRRHLLELIAALLRDILPRYRALAESGRVELSFTPFAHPIMPLLLDLQSAREAMPNVLLPMHPAYPDGATRVRWHIEQGRTIFQKYFGFQPQGCWPSEGGISTATLQLLEQAGVRWAASGQTVLANSLHAAPELQHQNGNGWLHQPYRLNHGSLLTFFRDDGLSDAIGFRYADWHADDAVADFLHHLETIRRTLPEGGVVSVILDGENAWEYYPHNGFHFLQTLYRCLSTHPRVRLRTFAELCAEPRWQQTTALPRVVAGSWVYGTFSTWIGDPDKNDGWDRLIEAKVAVDVQLQRHPELDTDALREQLAICEGSDWCWWFGAYNPAGSVSDFEALYREHLANLYRCAHLPVPERLSEVLSQGGGDPAAGGTMRRGQDGS